MSTELVALDNLNAIEVFTAEGGIEPLIASATEVVESFEHDMSTGVARKRTASLARKVGTLKRKLDDEGKNLTTNMRAKVKLVDGNRKALRDALAELKVEARKPLDEWEAEQAEIKAEKERIAILAQIEADHELALYMHKDWLEQEEIFNAQEDDEVVADSPDLDLGGIVSATDDGGDGASCAETHTSSPTPDTTQAETSAPCAEAEVDPRRAINTAVVAGIQEHTTLTTKEAQQLVRDIVRGQIPHLHISYGE